MQRADLSRTVRGIDRLRRSRPARRTAVAPGSLALAGVIVLDYPKGSAKYAVHKVTNTVAGRKRNNKQR